MGDLIGSSSPGCYKLTLRGNGFNLVISVF